jgi:hypothetical protein
VQRGSQVRTTEHTKASVCVDFSRHRYMIGQNQPCLHVAHRYSNRPHSDNCKLSTRAKPCKSCSNMTPFRSDFVCLCEACMGTAQGRPATNRLPCTTLLRAHFGSVPFHSDTPTTERSKKKKVEKKKKKKKKKNVYPQTDVRAGHLHTSCASGVTRESKKKGAGDRASEWRRCHKSRRLPLAV